MCNAIFILSKLLSKFFQAISIHHNSKIKTMEYKNDENRTN